MWILCSREGGGVQRAQSSWLSGALASLLLTEPRHTQSPRAELTPAPPALLLLWLLGVLWLVVHPSARCSGLQGVGRLQAAPPSRSFLLLCSDPWMTPAPALHTHTYTRSHLHTGNPELGLPSTAAGSLPSSQPQGGRVQRQPRWVEKTQRAKDNGSRECG